MDDLDRLHRRLVQNIRNTRPEYLTMPFTVQELYEQLIPYRHHRRELAIESNQDYETAVARLLAGERRYVMSDPAMQEALNRELSSPAGDHGIFKEYAHSTVVLVSESSDARHGSASEMTGGEHGQPVKEASGITAVHESTPSGSGATVAYDITTPSTVEPAATPVPVPALLSSLANINVPTSCSFCSGTLPEDREVHYCPHCGENLRVRRCPACGGEMDNSWKFCVTCGRRGS